MAEDALGLAEELLVRADDELLPLRIAEDAEDHVPAQDFRDVPGLRLAVVLRADVLHDALREGHREADAPQLIPDRKSVV